VRGDTATNVTKSAYVDNGYELQVPLFVNEGDMVKIEELLIGEDLKIEKV